VTDTANWLTPETAIGCTLPCGAKVVEAWDGKDGGTAVNFDRPPSGGIDGDKFGRCFKADGRHYNDGLFNLIPAAPTSQPLHDDTARVQAMNAPDAVLKRVRLWAEHGLQSQLSDLVAAVAHIDAQADHITALTAERDAAVAEVGQIVAAVCAVANDYRHGLFYHDDLRGQMEIAVKEAIAAGAHKEQTDAG